ncbi:unnamed protein product, partial [Prorocentrum cordatum]
EAAPRAAPPASEAQRCALGGAGGAGLAQKRAGAEPEAACSGAAAPGSLDLVSPQRRSKRIRLTGSPGAASDSGSGTPSVLLAPSAPAVAIDLDDLSDGSPARELGPIGTAGGPAQDAG